MVEILWHRRETRRQTENTNLYLNLKDPNLLAPTWVAAGQRLDRSRLDVGRDVGLSSDVCQNGTMSLFYLLLAQGPPNDQTPPFSQLACVGIMCFGIAMTVYAIVLWIKKRRR